MATTATTTKHESSGNRRVEGAGWMLVLRRAAEQRSVQERARPNWPTTSSRRSSSRSSSQDFRGKEQSDPIRVEPLLGHHLTFRQWTRSLAPGLFGIIHSRYSLGYS